MPQLKIAYGKAGPVVDTEVEIEAEYLRRAGRDRIVVDLGAARRLGEIWPGVSIFQPLFHVVAGNTMFVECRVVKMAGDCMLRYLRVSQFPPPQQAGSVIPI